MKVAYDGTRFSGSQVQPGVRTVHGELVRALVALGAKEPRVLWAGRTDAGVSAAGNVAVFETDHAPHALLPALTFGMEDAWAWAWAEVPASFEPRHATRRWYRYHLRAPVEAAAMERALSLFVGEHDFTAFCRLEPGVNPLRRVDEVRVAREGPFLLVDVRGPNFLWNQVRRIVEASRRVAAGELDASVVEEALRRGAPADLGTAAPEPLVLMDVAYEGLAFREEPPRARLLERLRRRIDEEEARLAVLRTIERGGA